MNSRELFAADFVFMMFLRSRRFKIVLLFVNLNVLRGRDIRSSRRDHCQATRELQASIVDMHKYAYS